MAVAAFVIVLASLGLVEALDRYGAWPVLPALFPIVPLAVAAVVAECGVPERTLKRRFSAATGSTIIGYVQNLRVEEAKRLLESGDLAAEAIAAEVGYDNPAFFRRLFKRSTGLTAGQYRRMFRPILEAGRAGAAEA